MKKVLRILGILLLVLVVVAGLLVAFAPQRYTVERSVTINAPQNAIIYRMGNFHTWPTWTAWGKMDPTQKHTFTGTPNTVGATYVWDGEEVGAGKMTSTAITPTMMAYSLDFIKPFQSHNTGWVRADEAGNMESRATMGMDMSSPRPWNAVGWMFKGSVADDFEESLNTLKQQMETGAMPPDAM